VTIPFVSVEGELLGQLLRRRRHNLGLVLSDIYVNGIGASDFNRYEHEKRLPSPRTLLALCAFLSIPEEEAFTALNLSHYLRGSDLRGGFARTGRFPAVCGTVGGAGRHRNAKEELCSACRKAWNDYQNKTRWTQRRAANIPERAAIKTTLCVDCGGSVTYVWNKVPERCQTCRVVRIKLLKRERYRSSNRYSPKPPGGKSGSGFVGVYHSNGGAGWRYQITRGGRVAAFKDGFATAEEAHEARQKKLRELGEQ
jgi:hypothetical protein